MSDLIAIVPSAIDIAAVASGAAIVEPLYRNLGASDQVSKGPDLLASLKLVLEAKYGGQPKGQIRVT